MWRATVSASKNVDRAVVSDGSRSCHSSVVLHLVDFKISPDFSPEKEKQVLEADSRRVLGAI